VNAKNKPLLCYVTDRRQLPAGRTLEQTVSGALAAGAEWIQIREKDLPAADLLTLVRATLTQCARTTARVIVNDRLDVALAAEAHGVHLGSQSLPMDAASGWLRAAGLGGMFLRGASCHALEEVRRAIDAGADYAFFGPVFPTPSKVRFGPSLGLGALEEVCRSVSIPILAIGGVTRENLAQCVNAGAAGAAAIRMFQEARW